ncbi:hypothetical protein [Rhizobium halophytocola]|uniref:Uncharacterized protein n=1 Tax=Rhizobium halophytocola TaxID=735519 RepID=A0ABS4DWY7_9HYPH|nr:hypothetical protein [Rhizobium halophytocola]MBP1850203.1 hypothetical protein [Rhizobium halophytocola]
MLAMLAPAVLAGPVPALADWVLIRTVATNGSVVYSRLDMSVDTGDWKTVEGERTGNAVKVYVSSCDGKIRFRAFERDEFGFFTRQSPQGIKYCQAEVVFDDYVPTKLATVLEPGRLVNRTLWIAAFGDRVSGQHYAAALDDALAEKKFGFVAIAASELAASLRKAGQSESAKPFAALSVQATIAGVLDQQKADPSQLPILTGNEVGDLVMTPQAKSVLETYQQQALGLSKGAGEIGKTGWKTMRSLPGGDEVDASAWNLPTEALVDFKPGLLAVMDERPHT